MLNKNFSGMPNYQKISGNIEEIIIDNPKTPNKLIWVNINNAQKKELEYLRKKYKFNLSQIQASSMSALAQRPTIEKEKDYLFLIIHFPIIENGNVTESEIEFFIGKNYLISIHNNLHAINSFFRYCKKEPSSILAFEFESPAVLLYEILDRLMTETYNLLDQNSIIIYELEELIFTQKSKMAASKILSLRRNIIHMRKIMQNHKNIIKKLTCLESGLLHVDERDIKKYYNSLLEHSKRIWENLENQKDMIEVLNSTNESFLNYKISDIMKTLTIFSVIIFPLTLFATIFSMATVNGMPFVNTPNGFWIVVGIMGALCLIMLAFFAKKKWL